MLILEPQQRGPAEPLRAAPPRRAGSVRRTSTIDVTWPTGFDGPLALHGRARDLRTTPERSEVLATAGHTVALDTAYTITDVDGPDPRLADLVGASAWRGFRRRVAEVLPDVVDDPSPLRLLLDDVSPALLVSGFALLADDDRDMATDPERLGAQVDICAGWIDGGAMVSAIRTHHRTPTPVAVPSPSLDDPDDPLAWHDAPLPAPVATRRRRLLDVTAAGGALRIEALFRDSHVGPDGIERSFHEYAVSAVADRATGRLEAVAARPGVLPWQQCPDALTSAGRLVGTTLDDVRAEVRASFRGTSTCTHLNDVLAAVGDAPVLVAQLGC